ncbi:unnamed protein product, partial [Auanema sp. JU1783]
EVIPGDWRLPFTVGSFTSQELISDDPPIRCFLSCISYSIIQKTSVQISRKAFTG